MFLDATLMDVGSETWAAGARAQSGCETKTWNTEMQIQGIIKAGSCIQDNSHSIKFSILKGHLSKRHNRQCHKNNSYPKQNQCAQQHLEKELEVFCFLNLLNISWASIKGKSVSNWSSSLSSSSRTIFLNQVISMKSLTKIHLILFQVKIKNKARTKDFNLFFQLENHPQRPKTFPTFVISYKGLKPPLVHGEAVNKCLMLQRKYFNNTHFSPRHQMDF